MYYLLTLSVSRNATWMFPNLTLPLRQRVKEEEERLQFRILGYVRFAEILVLPEQTHL